MFTRAKVGNLGALLRPHGFTQRAMSGLEVYSVDTLSGATGGWARDRRLGSGAFGTVFRGTLNGRDVAVKRLRLDGSSSQARFLAPPWQRGGRPYADPSMASSRVTQSSSPRSRSACFFATRTCYRYGA